MELPQNLLQTFACVASEKKTSSQKWSCLKIYGKLSPVQHQKKNHFLPKWSCLKIYGKLLLVQNQKKKLPHKNGVATKFMANFCLCSLRKKTFYQKWSQQKIYGKLLPVQHQKKNPSSQKWSCLKIYGKLLLVQNKTKKTFPKKWSCHKIYCKLLLVQHQKKKLSSKNGVDTQFIVNFSLCSIRKKPFPPKIKLSQNLLQM